jgi:2-keto-myo-inositol isomerase
MKPRLCLNMASIKNAPLQRQIALARLAGFAGVGLWVDDLDAAARQGLTTKAVAAMVREAGLSVEELCFLGQWQDCEDGAFPSVLEEADRLARMSRSLGCGLLVAVPSLRLGVSSETSRRFGAVCNVTAAHGVRVALEFVGTAGEMKDLRSARRLIEAAGSPNGGVLLDTFHFFLGGSTLDDLAGMTDERLFLVHVSDAMAVSREKLSTFHDFRTFPGDGVIDFAPLRERLDRMGYRGAVSLEIWNQEMLHGDPERTALRGIKSLKALFS